MTRPSRRSKSGSKRVAPREDLDKHAAGGSGRTGKPPSFVALLSAIGAAALLLRLIHVLQTTETPTVVQLIGDAKGYFQWASRIAGGDWYGSETFYQAPLYPYMLAVKIKLFGAGVLGIRVCQAMLGAASVVLLGMATKRMFHAAAGLVAAAMYAIYPPAFYFDGIVQKTALASFLLAALLATTARFQDDHRRRWSAMIGIVLGLLVLTRENALLWLPILPLWIWFGCHLIRRERFIHIACYVGGLALVLLPVAARNASLGGEWSPTTFQAGPNFYIGNNLESNGLYRPLVPGHETPFYERADAQRLAEQAEGRQLSSREVSRFWADQAIEEIRAAPLHWVQLMIAKSFMVINHYEVPDVESIDVYADYSRPLRMIMPWWHFGTLFPLAVWGVVATRRQWSQLWLYYLLILVMAVAIVAFFILGRYRQPLVLLLVPFSAMGLVDLYQRIRMKNRAGVLAPLITSVVTAILCNLPVHDESTLNASSYMNAGVAAGQAGNMRVSIELLSHAVQTHPEMAEAHVNLGRALELTNRPQDALICFANAQKLDPTLVMVDAMMGRNYERIGNRAEALRHYLRAIEIDPQDAGSRQAYDRLLRESEGGAQ